MILNDSRRGWDLVLVYIATRQEHADTLMSQMRQIGRMRAANRVTP